MDAFFPFDRIEEHHHPLVGGKALTLAKLQRQGIRVPDGLCVTTRVYSDFLHTTGLKTRIGLEVGRLPLAQMRWEEIWDLSLRVRNLFLTTEMPQEIHQSLAPAMERHFGSRGVAVRSSSPQEDRIGASFAGLHESFVNVKGAGAILAHIRLVWASLWSDGALLYRRELGMDVQASSMAVIVQQMVDGDCSGVAFSRSPDGGDAMVVESVYGLNQGLVDGAVMPDRWTLDRRSGKPLTFTPAEREAAVRPGDDGVTTLPLTEAQKRRPPLDDKQLSAVADLARTMEAHFGRPQDVEWTFRREALFLLQSRPVTTTAGDGETGTPWSADDKRPWYLSLKRSFANLKRLGRRIEEELLPQMADEAARLAKVDLTALSDDALVDAIRTRLRIHRHWVDVYWRDFIPFAHGTRLFGQVYNDVMKPGDPYAFTALLGATRMTGLARNRTLHELAERIRDNPRLRDQLASGAPGEADPQFGLRLDAFLAQYGDLTFKAVRFFKNREGLVRLLLEMAARHDTAPAQPASPPDRAALTADFIARFPEKRRDFAREVLAIGRSSYRLRDNDNIVLSAIEAQLLKAVEEGKRRIAWSDRKAPETLTPQQVLEILADPSDAPSISGKTQTIDEPVELQARPELTSVSPITADGEFVLRARQIVGQPAGPGLAMGPARVVAAVDDLFRFKAGEVLVCDAIDPNMTFVVPLAAAVVERRGGMLVHGAIIAREYGLPCVTGVADAPALIHTGDRVTVDGYLGIVTIDAAP